MTTEFTDALAARESAAADLQHAAQLITDASQRYTVATDSILALIPTLTAAAGERAHARITNRFSAEPPADDREINQRKSMATASRHGAAGTVEGKITLALASGFQQGSAATTLGFELSPEAAAFLQAAVTFARGRPQFSRPTSQFYPLVQVQNQRLFDLAKELT